MAPVWVSCYLCKVVQGSQCLSRQCDEPVTKMLSLDILNSQNKGIGDALQNLFLSPWSMVLSLVAIKIVLRSEKVTSGPCSEPSRRLVQNLRLPEVGFLGQQLARAEPRPWDLCSVHCPSPSLGCGCETLAAGSFPVCLAIVQLNQFQNQFLLGGKEKQ